MGGKGEADFVYVIPDIFPIWKETNREERYKMERALVSKVQENRAR
jgi:hypothetical protein